jgi:N6-adenosine-specific RNA methylase IME4
MLKFPKRKYKTIYADPPWPESGGGKIKRGADRHYRLMTVKQIAALSVSCLADDNCHLYLWITNNYLPAGLEVMAAWGFRYVTAITWMKDRIGLGQYFRGMTEHCLFGVRGRLPYKVIGGKRQQGRTGFTAPKGRHSEKPDEMRQMIETVSYEPRIELFAREACPGWDAWGDEINKDVAQC